MLSRLLSRRARAAARVSSPPGPELPIDRRLTRRNVAWSAVNQFFVEAAMTLCEASTVLVLLVRALGGSTFLAGLLPSLRFFGWLTPQFFAAGRLQRLPRLMPAIGLLEAVRYVIYVGLGGLVLALGVSRPGLVLAAFFVLFVVTRIAAGSSAVARAELVGRLVPPEERAGLVALRMFAGGVAGFMAGLAVRYVLDEGVTSFPINYALLFFLSAASFILAVAALGRVRERHREPTTGEAGLLAELRRAPQILRADRRFARLVAVRAAATGFEAVSPFYIIYATEQLGAPPSIAGVYIALRTLSRVASNLYWGKRCRQRGSLGVLRAGLALGALAPAAALLFVGARVLSWGAVGTSAAAWLYGAVFLIDGLAIAAFGVASQAYLYDIAPEHEFPTYFGLANTLLGPLYFLPAVSGALLGVLGYGPILLAAAVMLLAGYLISLPLREPPRAAPATPADRCTADSQAAGGQ